MNNPQLITANNGFISLALMVVLVLIYIFVFALAVGACGLARIFKPIFGTSAQDNSTPLCGYPELCMDADGFVEAP